MPLPAPRGQEERDDFVSRCIEELMESEEADDTEQAAAICNEQWREAKEDKVMSDERVIGLGGSVKALGEGKVGGFLVEFTDPEHPDLEADYFDASTDYGPHRKSLTFYHHGQDKALGNRPLKNTAYLFMRDAGVWMEHQLDMRDEYEAAIYQLAEQGKIGLSSGTAPHLVEREEKGNVYHITRWPLGLDASYTPTPANWQSRVMPMKTYLKSVGNADLAVGDDFSKAEPEAEAETEAEARKGAEVAEAGQATEPETEDLDEAAAQMERAAAKAKMLEMQLALED